MSLSGATTAVKVALWDRKYRCKTKGLNLYVRFMKNRYNRLRRYSKLELLDWEQEQIDDLFEAEAAEAVEDAQSDEAVVSDDFDWYDDDHSNDYEDYEDWDDSDWMYEFDRQDEIQEQKELAWKQFEMAQAVPEDDLESAFNGVWKQFAA